MVDDDLDRWEPSATMMKELGKLRHDTVLSDFTIASSAGKEWRVHKLVLRFSSDVLYRMSTSEDFVECKSGRAVLHDIDDRCINSMIDYLYTHSFDFPSASEVDDRISSYPIETLKEFVEFSIDMWQLADMYNIKGMQWKIVCDFKEAYCWYPNEGFVERLGEVFSEVDGVPDRLQRDFVGTLSSVLSIVERSEAEGLLRMVKKNPDMAAAVLENMVDGNPKRRDDRSTWGE